MRRLVIGLIVIFPIIIGISYAHGQPTLETKIEKDAYFYGVMVGRAFEWGVWCGGLEGDGLMYAGFDYKSRSERESSGLWRKKCPPEFWPAMHRAYEEGYRTGKETRKLIPPLTTVSNGCKRSQNCKKEVKYKEENQGFFKK